MITLYHCHAARSFRPLWMLEELGLPYDLKMLPFPPRLFAKEYLSLNPLGTIPLMIDGETRMTESSGICHYLGTRHGPTPLIVGVDEPAYGAFLNWMYFSDATLTFPQTLVLRYTQLEPEERRNPQVAMTTPNGSWGGCGRSRPLPPMRRRSPPAGSPRPISSSATRCGSPKISGWRKISAQRRGLLATPAATRRLQKGGRRGRTRRRAAEGAGVPACGVLNSPRAVPALSGFDASHRPGMAYRGSDPAHSGRKEPREEVRPWTTKAANPAI